MCGIIAIHHKMHLPIDAKLLKKMGDTLHHRGPDDEGIFIENQIGFFHKRLSIIDLSGGHQPMTDNDCTIAFNGEIYNYVELRQGLVQKGYHFKTHSDTEVILKMYQEYGKDAIALLNGMFAFLLYDTKKQLLLAARDHFGIKPLYYYYDKGKNIFASEIKAILAHPDVQAEFNQESLNEYLTFQFVLGEKTLFKNINKVLPGHFLVIDLNDSLKNRLVKYWEPTFRIDTHHTLEYFVYELQRLLEDTIKIQLRSDVPLGTYLSGGIDSSIVTLLASRHVPDSLRTFTGAFREGSEFDETGYADLVGRHCNAQMFKIYPTEADFVEVLPKLIYQMDEPTVGPGLFPQYMVSKMASGKVKVILGGQGGDEIFGGYTRYVIAYLEQALKGAIYETNDEGEHIVSLQSIVPNLPSLKQYVPMMRNFWRTGAFEDMDRRYFHLIDRSESTLDLYTEDFRQRYNKEQIFSNFQQLFNHPDTRSYFNKMTNFDMFGSLPGLLQVEDRVSMAVSLESRVPLLDKRIVDLIASMPVAMKFKGGEMKYILKKAARNILPPEILNRKDKMGFPVPLSIWAKNGASDFIKDTLLCPNCKKRGIFDPKKMEQLIDNERSYGRTLWGALCLELWFQQFIDKKIV
ncbi:MAG: asparagine synthase (glutamine-hydrolyzing) [Saprospiraceae bacterium]|nr:asparagine synthase (glutamine-hydrolyzing) [Saprospiraceae bacterium]MCB9322270.1 asparagine synthase (glutamine-hydrolyzing) [Lewinellaceae bacterium]